jgi:hypothetical protein
VERCVLHRRDLPLGPSGIRVGRKMLWKSRPEFTMHPPGGQGGPITALNGRGIMTDPSPETRPLARQHVLS